MDAITRPKTSRRDASGHNGRAFTVLELLVAIGMVGLLFALLLPALASFREAARRGICAAHLREIGLAFHAYHDRLDRLPTAWRPASNERTFAYGWATQILADVEQGQIVRQLRFDRAPTGPTNPAGVSLPLMLCPSDITEPTFELWQGHEVDDSTPIEQPVRLLIQLPAANYQGVFGAVEADEAPDETQIAATRGGTFGDGSVIHDAILRWADLERGLSHTLLVGERTMATVPSTWLGVDLRGEDATCRLVGSALTRPNCGECDECEFTSRHAGGAAFVWADGHVELVKDDIDAAVYQQLARRAAE